MESSRLAQKENPAKNHQNVLEQWLFLKVLLLFSFLI